MPAGLALITARSPAKEADVMGDPLRPAVSDLTRRLDRFERGGIGALDVAAPRGRHGRHRQVRHLDTAETVFAADLDAGLETRMRALHPADHVFDVAKPAERGGLQFRRAGPLGKDQRRLVLALAAGDVAAREPHLSAQVVRARAFDPRSKLAG